MTEPNPADVLARDVWMRAFCLWQKDRRHGEVAHEASIQSVAAALRQPTDARIAREEAIEECAAIADSKNHDSVLCSPSGRARDIARAIRALKEDQTNEPA